MRGQGNGPACSAKVVTVSPGPSASHAAEERDVPHVAGPAPIGGRGGFPASSRRGRGSSSGGPHTVLRPAQHWSTTSDSIANALLLVLVAAAPGGPVLDAEASSVHLVLGGVGVGNPRGRGGVVNPGGRGGVVNPLGVVGVGNSLGRGWVGGSWHGVGWNNLPLAVLMLKWFKLLLLLLQLLLLLLSL